MTGVLIEGGLNLSDGGQVGERSLGARTNLAGAPDGLRQIAVRIGDLDSRHEYDGSDHQDRNPSTRCVQPNDRLAEVRARASQASRRWRPTMQASPTCISESPPRRRATSSGQTPISQPGVPRMIASTIATNPSDSIRTSNHQTRSASGNPHAAPRVASPTRAAMTTALKAAATAPTSNLRFAAGPAKVVASTPARITKVANISRCRNQAVGSLRMCGFRKRAEPRQSTIDRKAAAYAAARPARAILPIGPVRGTPVVLTVTSPSSTAQR